MHAGRVAHPDHTGGKTPISASAVAAAGDVHTHNGRQQHVRPKEATAEDIKNVLAAYKKSAELAKKAGFDGVEIQAGAGVLVDQFLRDGTNKRTDNYGGSAENRCRFLNEVVDAVASVFTA